jgi:hypothetical protein
MSVEIREVVGGYMILIGDYALSWTEPTLTGALMIANDILSNKE